MVTIINQKNGKVSKFTTKSKNSDYEELLKKEFRENKHLAIRTTRGLNKHSFLKQDDSREWMVKRIESLARTDFDHVMRKGVPDLLVAKKEAKKMAFVEVKSSGDGLRSTQLRWMRLFDSMPVKIAYVEKRIKWQNS